MTPGATRDNPETAAPFLTLVHGREAVHEPARAYLAAHGLPTPRQERWKYTQLAPFVQSGVARAQKPALAENPVTLPWLWPHSRKLVFVNGFLALGDARLTRAAQTGAAVDDAPLTAFPDAGLWALNTLLAQDGAHLNITDDGAVFEIMYLGQWADQKLLASPRGRIRLAPNIAATVVERFLPVGAGPVHTNAGLDIDVGAGARLTHIRVQDEGRDRHVLTSTHVHVARDATYDMTFLNLGAALARQDVWVELDGAGASATVGGAQLLTGRQHGDTTVQVDHHAPHGTSRQIIRNVLDGESTGVFQGKVQVDRAAQLTDGSQLCNTLMLSDRARMNTKPELEIYADDVKCSHGTTTGALDEEPLFYLRSRGIPANDARRMLLLAFIGDLYAHLPDAVQTALMQQVEGWFDDSAHA